MNSEENKISEAKSFHLFFWKDMLIFNALTNGILNGLIYFLITREVSSNLNYFIGTLISNAVLGLILIFLYPVLIKHKLKKKQNIVVPYQKENHLIASLYPNNIVLIRIINIVICFVLSTIFSMGIIACFNLPNIGLLKDQFLEE